MSNDENDTDDESETVKQIEIANFEGPDCYMSLRVTENNELLLVSEFGYCEVIHTGFGRWYSEKHEWKELHDECEDEHMVECVNCGEAVSIGEARSGIKRQPIHDDCFDSNDCTDTEDYDGPRVKSEFLDHMTQYTEHWKNKDEEYWLKRLQQEISELILSIDGEHDDPVEHELRQIAGICVNWLRHFYGENLLDYIDVLENDLEDAQERIEEARKVAKKHKKDDGFKNPFNLILDILPSEGSGTS